jgi:hypothetical protein
VASAGDALCQKYFDDDNNQSSSHADPKPLDYKRVTEMGVIQAFVMTPFTLNWFKLLLTV